MTNSLLKVLHFDLESSMECFTYGVHLWSAYSGTATDARRYVATWCYRGRHGEYRRLLGTGVERAMRVNGAQTCEYILHQAAARSQERCQGCAMDSRVSAEKPYQRQLRA